MGVLRYLLSTLVLISHMGISLLGVNPGVVAVVVFYLLSGFVVQTLLQSQPVGQGRYWQFYRDRSWRIFPLYFTALILAMVIWLAGAQSDFLSMSPGPLIWLQNLTVIPLNFYMYTGIDGFTLLPPAWSLGAELQFYLLAPLLIILSARSVVVLLGVSAGIFALAQLSVINTDYFGYRLFPGVLFIFMLGMHCARLDLKQRIASPLLLGGLIGAGLYLCWLIKEGVHRPFDREVAAGLLLGLPLMALLPGLKLSATAKQLDRLAGNTAYGVFLFHFPMIWLAEMLALDGSRVVFVLISSTVLALAGHCYIEKPLWTRYRKLPAPCGRSLRERHSFPDNNTKYP